MQQPGALFVGIIAKKPSLSIIPIFSHVFCLFEVAM